jgi:hypothetical protein
VTRTLTSWTRPLAGLLALVVGLTLVTPPAASAADTAAAPAPARPAPSRLAASTAAKLAALAPAPTAFAQTQTPPAADTGSSDNRPFFKTPTGVAALILMVAGAGYVAYRIPKDNEKVHSPIR